MTNENGIQIWIPFAAIALLMLVSAMLSLSSGWYRLAKRFPDRTITNYKQYAFIGMSLGVGLFTVAYGGGVCARLTPQGLRLSAIILLRFLHPPMFIPWSDVSSCVREEVLVFNVTKLSVKNEKSEFAFYGKLGEAIYNACISSK